MGADEAVHSLTSQFHVRVMDMSRTLASVQHGHSTCTFFPLLSFRAHLMLAWGGYLLPPPQQRVL